MSSACSLICSFSTSPAPGTAAPLFTSLTMFCRRVDDKQRVLTRSGTRRTCSPVCHRPASSRKSGVAEPPWYLIRLFQLSEDCRIRLHACLADLLRIAHLGRGRIGDNVARRVHHSAYAAGHHSAHAAGSECCERKGQQIGRTLSFSSSRRLP